jgi:hypothetical protein
VTTALVVDALAGGVFFGLPLAAARVLRAISRAVTGHSNAPDLEPRTLRRLEPKE